MKLLNITPPRFLGLLCLLATQDFPVFVWRQEHKGVELPKAILSSFGGTNVERAESAEWVLEGGLDFYVGHAPGREELHLRRTPQYQAWFNEWFATRDPALNVREPCLTDPATRAKLFAQLELSLQARGGNHGTGISLGDEVSLTPWGDPLDVCNSKTCEAQWLIWCERNGIENRRSPTTDQVRLELTDDNFESLGNWLARRRFHQDVVLELLEELATRAREQAPGVRVGLLGIGGQTAFGGVAIGRALQFLDFVEPYPVDATRELTSSTLNADQQSFATLFLNDEESGSVAGAALRAWEHQLRGGDGLILWSDKLLAANPAYANRLARVVESIRRVRRLAPELVSPGWGTPWRAAIVHSPDSIANSWLHDALLDGPTWPNRLAGYQRNHGTRERTLTAWLRLLEDAGSLPGVLPVDELKQLSVTRFPLLIFSHVGVLDDGHIEHLKGYLHAGGRIFVEGSFGRFDSAGNPRETSLREELAEFYGERVIEAPSELMTYAERRLNPTDARALLDRKLVAGRFSRVMREPRIRIIGGDLPWLTEFRVLENGTGWLYMALPNATTPEERAGVRDLEVELELPEESQVEWLHPQTASGLSVTLPAGEALVFRLLER